MNNYDILARQGLKMDLFVATLTHNTQATLLMPIVTNKRPYAVMILDAAFPKSGGFDVYSIGFAWDLDANLKVRVTPQFSAAVSAQCNVAVLYKV